MNSEVQKNIFFFLLFSCYTVLCVFILYTLYSVYSVQYLLHYAVMMYLNKKHNLMLVKLSSISQREKFIPDKKSCPFLQDDPSFKG